MISVASHAHASATLARQPLPHGRGSDWSCEYVKLSRDRGTLWVRSGCVHSGHSGVPLMYATPLNNATSSWSSPVTRMRQVESVRVREISAAFAVRTPPRDALYPA